MTTTELLISRNGQYFVDGDTTFTAAQKVAFIVVNEDAILTNFTSQSDADLVAQSGISAKTITKGMILAAKNGEYIKRVNVSSGSIIAVFA
jgi:hypothetical protein